MDFIHAHSEAIISGSVILINAILTRCPKVKENDIFHIVGTIFSKVFGTVTTKAE